MATIHLQIVNPNTSGVTVNGQTAKANAITKLSIDNTTTDAYGFLAAGCALTSDDGSTFRQRQDEGFLLYTGEAEAVDEGQ